MTNQYKDLLKVQLELEDEMLSAGRDRFYKAIEDAKARGEESSTTYGNRLIKQLVMPTASAIEEFLQEADSGRAGKRHSAVRYLRLLDPETTAYLALKRVLDGITKQHTLQHVSIAVASALQSEVWMTKFKDAHPDKFAVTMRHVSSATSRRHAENVARIMAGRVGVTEDWPTTDKLQIGAKLIELLQEKTGLVHVVRRTVNARDTRVYVEATPATLEWITNANERMDELTPAFLPTVIPPKKWEDVYTGGYHSGLTRNLHLVKGVNGNHLEELDNFGMTDVLRSVNAMQETPWRVNKPVLDILCEAWNSDMRLAALPPMEADALPPKPGDIETNDDTRKEWKRKAAKVHASNSKLRSKRLQLRKIIEIARKFEDFEAIYFPHQLDFRGRAYCVPMFLNPQGPDHAKSLLTFAQGKAIGTGDGPRWLAIHGSNTYGYDKVSLDARVDWVIEHESQIIEAATLPLDDGLKFWAGADKPWQFLAFCLEWAAYKREGAAFKSSLPIALDGSCNGLQHYSAALRDPVGGRAVNLLPSDKPQDIYAKVAEVTQGLVESFICPDSSKNGTILGLEKLRETWARFGIDEREMAHRWLAFGLNRKLTKRSVMTLPYGSTTFSCREFLQEATEDQIAAGKPNVFALGPEDEGIFRATMWLQPLVWQAIGEVVKAARVGMDWLKDCAKLAAKEGLPVIWETPDGFLVQQMYRNTKARRIVTKLDGFTTKLTLREDLPTLDKKRQASGIAPNWVHSMDATAMRMFVNLAKERGLDRFALVHDSYGTTAADVGVMADCLREAFISLYTLSDPLASFRVDVAMLLSDELLEKLPALPDKGILDIQRVAESDFFFA
ncbi:DNA-directed RNA polymerase [Martelella mangrovi]|uniref:DNA-directed RNA polymerase n=1 Tax=Martelella mangrovi TaxID=1397477 RepID=A0ABV2IE29_9HYPH